MYHSLCVAFYVMKGSEAPLLMIMESYRFLVMPYLGTHKQKYTQTYIFSLKQPTRHIITHRRTWTDIFSSIGRETPWVWVGGSPAFRSFIWRQNVEPRDRTATQRNATMITFLNPSSDLGSMMFVVQLKLLLKFLLLPFIVSAQQQAKT